VKRSFHPEALEEYLGAVAYYADINPRLAESFINAFESGVEEIAAYLALGRSLKKMCDAISSSVFHSAFTIVSRLIA
jgi:hypothetical protein